MARNLARVQGRYAVTPHGGASEVHRWMCHTGWRRTRLVRPMCHEAWPRLSLGMKYSQWQRAVVGRREASAQRSARAAPRKGAEVGYASLGVPLPCFLPFVLWFLALLAARIVEM